MIRCFDCGFKNEKPKLKKSVRRYEDLKFEGGRYYFTLEVETPYCENCGEQLYDENVETIIREKAHKLIVNNTKSNKIITL